MFTQSVLIALAIFVVFLKLDIRKVVNWDIIIDIVFTVTLAALFSGTFSGLMVAGIAGLILTGLLAFSRAFFGVKIWRGWKKGFDPIATNVSGW